MRKIRDELVDLLDNKKLIYFVNWYINGANEDTFEKEVSKYLNNIKYEYAMSNYLDRPDVQQCLIHYTKVKKDFNLVSIYNTMVRKALEGDVNSANWVVKFSDSKFFKSNKTEIDSIIDGLDLGDDND